MGLFSSFLSLCLAAVLRAKISPWGSFNTTQYQDDLVQYNLTELFDFSSAQPWTCQVVASPATIVDQNTSIQTRILDQYHFTDVPEVANFITNTTFFAVYDNSRILIQEVSLDGESFGQQTVHLFGRPGVDAICTDVALNAVLGRAYVVCHSNLSSKLDKYIYVAEIDAQTGAELNVVSIPFDVAYPVAHRMRVGVYNLWPADAKGSVVPYVLVYDQGGSSAYASANQWFFVLSGAQSGNLKPEGYASLNLTNLNFNTMFDIYDYQNQLLISGRNKTESTLGFAFCYFTLGGQIAMNCSSFKNVSLADTTVGYIGLMNTGQYVEINNSPTDPASRMMVVCDLIDSFYSLNFIDRSSCVQSVTYVLPENVYITKVEGNVHQVVVKYAHFDGTYAGFSLHDYDLKYEFSDIDDSQAPHAIPIGKTLIKVGRDTLNLTRQVKPYVFVDLNDLMNDTVTTIRVECSDSEGLATNFIQIYKMSDMRKNVVGDPDSIPAIGAYPGTEVWFQLDPHEVLGNDLKLFVDADPHLKNLTQFSVYDTESINVNFESSSSTGRFASLYFSGKYAIGKDAITYKIIVFLCHFADIRNLKCVEQAAFGVGTKNAELQEDIVEIFDYLFAWSVDRLSKSTTVYIFDGQNSITAFPVDGIATDGMMVELDNKAYLALAFQDLGLVRNFILTDGNVHILDETDVIDQRLSAREYFCPKNVTFSPQASSSLGIIEILSVCPGLDQRILRYKYPPTVINRKLVLPLINTVPINFEFADPLVCSMGSEFVIWSNLNRQEYTIKAVNVFDDRNDWNFGVKDFDIGTLAAFDCVQRAGVFTTVSLRGGEKVLSVWWGNNQHQTNHRLYNTLRTGLTQYKQIRSFEFEKQVIHLALNLDGSFDFFLTWTKGPVVDLNFLNGFPVGKSYLTFKYFNSMQGGRLVYQKPVTITAPRVNVTFDTSNKLSKVTQGELNIENHLKIKGPIIHAQLLGNDSVEFVPRIARDSEYIPTPDHQNTFQHLESFGDILVGVHIDLSNASTFTIFHGIDEFNGTFVPAHGVNSFHFAPFPSDPGAILIAYSTAEPSNNSLQLVALNGSDRIAITHSQDGLVLNFTKIRVVPLSIPNVDAWRIFALNEVDGHLACFTARMDGGKIDFSMIDNHTDVATFSWASPKNSDLIFVFYTSQSDRTNMQYFEYPKNASVGAAKKGLRDVNADVRQLHGLDSYLIISVECRDHDASKFFCLLNTQSPFVSELIWDATNFSVPQTFTYFKLPGYQGRYIDATRDYFVFMAATYRPTVHVKYLAYKRGSPDVFYTQDSDVYRPFTIATCRHNMTHFQFTSAFPEIPLFFLVIGPMKVTLPDKFNLSSLSIDFQAPVGGLPDSIISLSTIYSGDTTSSVPWWPVFAILALLILLAVAFIGVKSQQAPEQDWKSSEPETYNSLKEDLKISGKVEESA